MTVCFADMKDFTSLSEGVTPVALVNVINRYLATMSEPIRRSGGIIDKYIGDAIMAFWGPPFTTADEQARLACEATLGQLALLPSFRHACPRCLASSATCRRSTCASASPPAMSWSAILARICR